MRGTGEAGITDGDHILLQNHDPGHGPRLEGRRSNDRDLLIGNVLAPHQRDVDNDLDLGHTPLLDGTDTAMESERCKVGILHGQNDDDLEVHAVMTGMVAGIRTTEQ